MAASLWKTYCNGDDIDPRPRSCQRDIWQEIKKGLPLPTVSQNTERACAPQVSSNKVYHDGRAQARGENEKSFISEFSRAI